MKELNPEISHFRDGSVVLSLVEDDDNYDLVFAFGAINGNPMLDKQRAMLERIVQALKYQTIVEDMAKRMDEIANEEGIEK